MRKVPGIVEVDRPQQFAGMVGDKLQPGAVAVDEVDRTLEIPVTSEVDRQSANHHRQQVGIGAWGSGKC